MSSRGYGINAYLLGIGPAPQPRPMDIAVAAANYMLDHPNAPVPHVNMAVSQQSQDPELAQEQNGSNTAGGSDVPRDKDGQEIRTIECDLHINTTDPDLEPTVSTRRFSLDLEPQDFLERICLAMGLPDRTKANIAYKWPNEADKAAKHALKTDQDIQECFRAYIERKKSARRNAKPVKIIVYNLDAVERSQPKASGKRKRGQRESQSAGTSNAQPTASSCHTELEILMEKRKCTHTDRSGAEDTYCWVDPKTGAHHDISLELLQLWARYLKNGAATVDEPPTENSFFIHLMSRERRAEREATRNLKNLPINVIINNGPSPSVTSVDTSETNSSRSFPSTRESSSGRLGHADSDIDDDDDAPLRIGDALARIHAREPDTNYPQYEGAFAQHGVFYAHYLLEMKDHSAQVDFLVNKVKMLEGCVPAFLRRIKQEVRFHKKRRLEKSRAPELRSEATEVNMD